ncbi:MAG: TolC family protein, partial [Candidatus Halalkalibacterium sp. M3_1C_030]
MNKIIFAPLILLLSLFLIPPLAVKGQTNDSTLVLDELIQKVLAQNPELQSSFQGWEASKTRISQQEALPDPTLGLNLMNLPVNSFALDQEPMTGKQIS